VDATRRTLALQKIQCRHEQTAGAEDMPAPRFLVLLSNDSRRCVRVVD
jgi:hypothetical protein